MKSRPSTNYQPERAAPGGGIFTFLCLEWAKTGRMPMMERGDIIAGEISTRRASAFAREALADHQPAYCGAMLQQGFGHGPQSWPQQFIRLVGGHRRPAPLNAAPVQN
jgi:hypothetical protein